MQRLSQAARAFHKPLQARSSYVLCQSWLPTTPEAERSLQDTWFSLLQLNPMCTQMHGFSSQGLAATPPEEEVQEQQGQQPLARYLGRQVDVLKDRSLKASGCICRVVPKDMIAMYTCNICKTRSAKMFSKKTYETGVVIVRCPGCQGNHLIADRLGWFGEPGSIEDYLKQQGEEVTARTMDGTTQLSAEDVMGWSKAR